MTEPQRLREGKGPAATLLSAAELEVPSAARKRALAFTGVAAGMLSNSGALAATGAALAKSVMLWVAVGTVGGGVVSFTVAETISRLDSRELAQPAAAPPLPLPPPHPESAPRVEPAPPVEGAPPSDAPPHVAAAPASPPAPSSAAAFTSSPRASAPRPGIAAPSSVESARPRAASLFEEQRNIEAARAAVARGDAAAALSTLDDYQRSYPQGQFGPEALALRVEALLARGDRDGARAFARQFERRYPHHPLLSRVQGSAGR